MISYTILLMISAYKVNILPFRLRSWVGDIERSRSERVVGGRERGGGGVEADRQTKEQAETDRQTERQPDRHRQ